MRDSLDDPDAIGVAPTIESTPRDGDHDPATVPGKRFAGDKYRIDATVGEGTFGTIHRARDTHLDRDVALEIGPRSDEALARAERDAKLAHANVVVVYETGELDGRVFIAREYVGGSTARAWLDAAPRTAKDIIAMACAAGDGLAAAHAAGIVHGSVSADAIVIGDDDRPRIAQFGPATGATIEGDQQAFRAMLESALRDVRGVPGHALAALHRDWPSMAALVRELRRDPSQRRRRIALAAVAVVAIGGAAAATVTLRGSGPPPCADDDAALAPVWSTARADAIGRAFDAAGGAAGWRDLSARLDAYGRAWIVARHEACRATRIDETQPEAILDRRMLCIDRARAQLDSVVTALAVGDRAAVANAPQAAALLPDLSRCADVGAMATEAAPPADAAARAKIERSIREVADARTSLVWGAKDGVAVGERVLASAIATGWPPAIADAKLLRGSMLLDAQEVDRGRAALEESAQYALTNHLDEIAAFSMASLGKNLAQAGRHDAEHWITLARSLWTHLGEPPVLGELVLRGEANLAMDAGKLDDAVDATRRAIALSRRTQGETPLDHYNLANVFEQKDDDATAAKEIAIGLAAAEARWGKDHPMVARFAYKAAEIEMYRSHFPEALALAHRAIAINEAWYGPDDVHLIDALEILGSTLGRASRPDEARTTLDRALAILHAHSPDSAEINIIENIVADMEGRLKHWDAAVERGARALASDEARFGKDSPYIMMGLVNVGIFQRHRKHPDESAALLERAVAITTKAFGASAGETINAQIELSYSRIEQGRVREAAAMLEPAIALVEAAKDMPPPIAAEAHQAYADALWRAGGDHVRARAAAVKARDGFAALGESFDEQRKESDAWLASHR